MSFRVSDYGLIVEVEGKKLTLTLDLETAEFIVQALPTDDEVTRLIAIGACELALVDVPQCRHVVGMDNRRKL